MKKRILCIALVLLLTSSSTPFVAISAGYEIGFAETLAVDLKTLGLFMGVSDTNFDLDRAPTRTEALIMLIRVLGKESEVQSGSFQHPFTDVVDWANDYIGYAYTNNLTNGISTTEFGKGNATAAMYLTFVLRALDYSDADGGDFSWNDPFTLSKSVGILPDIVDISNFRRSDVVIVSYASLAAPMKGSTQTLADKLINAGVFSRSIFDSNYDSNAIANYSTPTNTATDELCYCGEHYLGEIIMQAVPPINIHAIIPQYEYQGAFPLEKHRKNVTDFLKRFDAVHTIDYITWESDWYDTVIIWSDTPLKDFSFVALKNDENFDFSATEVLFAIDELPSNSALVINVNFSSERLYRGEIIFTDANNVQKHITFSETAIGGCDLTYRIAPSE